MKDFKLIMLLPVFNFCNAEKVFKNDNSRFRIDHPKEWIIAKDGEAVDNLKINTNQENMNLYT